MFSSDYNLLCSAVIGLKKLYLVQPLPSCSTVSINVLFNKSLHHNQGFFKENVRYPIWICRDPISLILGTRFSLILGTR